ncbi:MAG: hypothetical protein LUQ25_00900 [Methanoregulaceae archaeon]|nr:hypothetical protein [Methanoregulaceae archaeon]
MTRGHPAVRAVEEAIGYAERNGWRVITVGAGQLPCDFMAIDGDRITLVKVRRVRYRGEDISRSCGQEIEDLRAAVFPAGRELWVRGPDRTWYRYAVLQDQVVRVREEAITRNKQ